MGKCYDIVDAHLEACADDQKRLRSLGYSTKHCQDHIRYFQQPRWQELPIVHLVKALATYGDAYRAEFDGEVGEDGVLADEWLAIAKATVALLDGPTGRLDCGRIDTLVRDLAEAVGFTRDLTES